MKFIVIITLLGFDETPWKMIASSLGQRDTLMEHGSSNTNGIVENGTGLTVTRFDNLATDFSSNVTLQEKIDEHVGDGAIVPGSSQSRSKAMSVKKFEEMPKSGSQTSPESITEAKVNQTIRFSHRSRLDPALNDQKTSTEKSPNLEELRKTIEALKEPITIKCSPCPTDQSFCCESGCCGRAAFWMEPPAVYYLIACISVIAMIVGATVFACNSEVVVVGHVQNRACSQPGPVIFKVKDSGVKVRNLASSSTCESNLSDIYDRNDDVFGLEFPDAECREVHCHVDEHQGEYYNHHYYQYHVDYCTNDTNCIVDYQETYGSDD